MHTEETSKISPLAHLLVDFFGDSLGFVPFVEVRLDFILHPCADFIAESGVGFVVVWGMVLRKIMRSMYSFRT